ncbi:MAG: CidA/LrgA family protein [Anaerococcus vaginalis]|uniref:CidA/LrgA family protein n=1 Tax=Anaerococcus vaginalis TaxID=33037 RepID=UPI0029009E87|nr:CidA/LrgA family protein [Anaerococcus vaginalis]MDU0945925.1 CidA/LrgA family protein [Anaerococcus vaginalis]MDU1030224.1 CidA/LrgA family protein [Anaerococcus vaginalis]
MYYLKEFVILCVYLFLGAITRSIINYPIPEPVYGMIYLFIALQFSILKSEDIKETSDGILKNLAFLFVPAGVGILANVDVIKGKIFQIIILVIIGTIISMALTGLVVQFLQRRKDA